MASKCQMFSPPLATSNATENYFWILHLSVVYNSNAACKKNRVRGTHIRIPNCIIIPCITDFSLPFSGVPPSRPQTVLIALSWLCCWRNDYYIWCYLPPKSHILDANAGAISFWSSCGEVFQRESRIRNHYSIYLPHPAPANPALWPPSAH